VVPDTELARLITVGELEQMLALVARMDWATGNGLTVTDAKAPPTRMVLSKFDTVTV